MVYKVNTKLVPLNSIGGFIEGGKGHPGCKIATGIYFIFNGLG